MAATAAATATAATSATATAATTSAKRAAKPSIQLIAFTVDKINFYYGELHDDHILRGSPRGLYTSNVKIVDITAEWQAYLGGRVVVIEQRDSKWTHSTIKPSCLKTMLQHESGYVVPLIRVARVELIDHFPRMATDAPMKMPAQTARAPGIVAAPVAKASNHGVFVKPHKRDDDADSAADAIVNGEEDPLDEGKKERSALSAAIAAVAATSRRRSVSFK